MKVFDITVLGELNIDLLLNEVNGVPEIGKETLAKEMHLTLGSSSAIFASNISMLGASVQFIGKLGDDIFGTFILKELSETKVSIKNIIVDPSLKTGATIILNDQQDRAMVTHPGAMETLGYDDINWNVIGNSKHLHIASVFLQPLIKKDLSKIFKQAKSLGLSTSLDTQWDPTEAWDLQLKDILPHVDIFLPNETELLNLTGKINLDDALTELEHIGNIIVVKMGKRGSLLAHRGKRIFLPALKMQTFTDAIGAGDSFNAGFIYKHLQQQAPEICQEFGNSTGAFSTIAAGGTTAFKQKLKTDFNAKYEPGYSPC